MARNRQPILKRCRALGIDPTVLGVNKKSNRGPRPNANTKPTEYAIQLKEKQKQNSYTGLWKNNSTNYMKKLLEKME